jgi:hypothetical protein
MATVTAAEPPAAFSSSSSLSSFFHLQSGFFGHLYSPSRSRTVPLVTGFILSPLKKGSFTDER